MISTVRSDFDRIATLIAREPERPDRYEPFLLAHLPASGACVLEVGCGAGRLARAVAARGAAVTAIDLSPEMIRLARERTPREIVIDYLCGDFSEHPWPLRSYDAVVSVATLHHVPAEPALRRMKSLVKPGGVLVVQDLRAPEGMGDWLVSATAAIGNGDAAWWIGNRLRSNRALEEAWHDHGSRDRYLTASEARALFDRVLPGAQVRVHPLWRYSAVWRSP